MVQIKIKQSGNSHKLNPRKSICKISMLHITIKMQTKKLTHLMRKTKEMITEDKHGQGMSNKI